MGSPEIRTPACKSPELVTPYWYYTWSVFQIALVHKMVCFLTHQPKLTRLTRWPRKLFSDRQRQWTKNKTRFCHALINLFSSWIIWECFFSPHLRPPFLHTFTSTPNHLICYKTFLFTQRLFPLRLRSYSENDSFRFAPSILTQKPPFPHIFFVTLETFRFVSKPKSKQTMLKNVFRFLWSKSRQQ